MTMQASIPERCSVLRADLQIICPSLLDVLAAGRFPEIECQVIPGAAAIEGPDSASGAG